MVAIVPGKDSSMLLLYPHNTFIMKMNLQFVIESDLTRHFYRHCFFLNFGVWFEVKILFIFLFFANIQKTKGQGKKKEKRKEKGKKK